MTAEQWIRANLTVIHDGYEDVIDWGNGIYTPVGIFVTMFGTVIQDAIDTGSDVREAIRNNDNGRGFASLV